MGVPSDNPIAGKADDRLGRAAAAGVIADEIRELDASEGCVVGILGPWGSGKTSLINMVRSELQEQPALAVLDFNPWMFSGADELLEKFFLEIGAQFRRRSDRLSSLADDLEAYGEMLAPLRLLPVVGVWVERARSASSALKRAVQRRREGVLNQRNQLATKLAALDAPIVIVIDDIDRLRTSEIRDIFKLVRLTAQFPNVIYALAFDRYRVEQALGEEGLSGRDYLEKILQVAWDIPVVPEQALTHALLGDLEAGLSDIEETGPFDDKVWPDVLMELMRPLIRNMRDVRRYVASVHGTVRALGGRVQLVDVLGLEAIRVFLPDVFGALVIAQEGLTTPSSMMGTHYQERPELKTSVEAIIAAAADRSDIARSLVRRLFPAGLRHIENNNYGSEWQKQWLRERRVAHPEILKLYLERVVGDKLQAFDSAERAFAVIDDQTALQVLVDSVSDDQLGEMIASLEVYEGEYPTSGVVPASVVLLNAIRRLPDRSPGFFGMRADLVVARVVLRLLRRLDGEAEVETAVKAILPQISSLSSRAELIRLVGHLENAGHKLVTETTAAEFETALRVQIRQATPEALATEWDLFRLLRMLYLAQAGGEPPFDLPKIPILDAAVLKAASTEVRSQSMGSRAVGHSKRLYWDALIELAGSEDAVNEMLERAGTLATDDVDLDEVVKLARRYLEGWRPDHDDD